jgi:predicted nucleic acid-binding protein
MLDRLGTAEQVLTTNFVVGETWTFLRRKGGHRTAVGFVDRVKALEKQSKLTIHRVTADQEQKAWRWLRRHDERTYSFVDAASFQVMRERRLREVLAFDQDFSSAGFLELRP